MPTTPNRGYHYPALDSPNNPPLDLQNLAEDVDADMTTRAQHLYEVRADVQSATAAFSNAGGKLVRREDDGRFNVMDPASEYNPVNDRTSIARRDAAIAASMPRGVAARRQLAWSADVASSAGFTATLPAGRFPQTPIIVATCEVATTDNITPRAWVYSANTTSASIRARAQADVTTFNVGFIALPVTA